MLKSFSQGHSEAAKKEPGAQNFWAAGAHGLAHMNTTNQVTMYRALKCLILAELRLL